MKKIIWFIISMLISTAILGFTAAVCLYFSGAFGFLTDSEDKNSINQAENIPESRNLASDTSILAIFSEGQRLETCIITVDFAAKKVDVSVPDIDGYNNENSAYVLQNEGLYPFVSRCFAAAGQNVESFLLINSENFVKITDKCRGIVYTCSDIGTVLLTGSQAECLINSENFAYFCSQLTEYALAYNKNELFSYLANNTVNNLSYPKFYDLIYRTVL